MADYSWPNVSMLEGCGESPLHPPSVAGTFYFGSRRKFIGAAAVLVLRPFAALAQQAGKIYRIGYLALLPGEDKTWAKPLVQRLQELG